jgi:hypothetical protein
MLLSDARSQLSYYCGPVEEGVHDGRQAIWSRPHWSHGRVIGKRPLGWDVPRVDEWVTDNPSHPGSRLAFPGALALAFLAQLWANVMGRKLLLYTSAHIQYDRGPGQGPALVNEVVVCLDGQNIFRQGADRPTPTFQRRFLCHHAPYNRTPDCRPDHVTMVVGAMANREASQLVDFLQDHEPDFRRAWEGGFET